MGQNQRFTPLTIGLIDEGRFMDEVERELDEVQRALIAYRQEHGMAAKGAKAEVNVKITLGCDDPENELFSIRAEMKRKLPARPASVTLAMPAEADDGTATLFVRRSGSSTDEPAQGRLTTDDGRVIDGKTGEDLKEMPRDGRAVEP